MFKSTRSRILIVVFAILTAGCKEQPPPSFVQELMDSHIESNIQAIWSFRYNGGTVYYIQSGCCDMYNELYNAVGKIICAPDGGFSGAGDGKCPDFWESAKGRVVIWERGK